MTATGRETALAALHTVIKTALEGAGLDVAVQDRNQEIAEPADVTVSGSPKVAAVLRDGDAQEPDALLGDPVLYDHVQGPVLEIVSIHPDSGPRGTALDTALKAVADALAADTTLGGACSYAQPHPPDFSDIGDADAPFGKAAEVVFDLLFTTESPLG